jgi:hypothetical protein
MTSFQREAAEASAKEIDAARAAASRHKNVAVPAAAATVPTTKIPAPQVKAPGGNLGWLPALIPLFAIFFYLLPALIGQSRHHHQRTAIWVLNIFLGWTVLGWIAALIWASTATPGAPGADVPVATHP